MLTPFFSIGLLVLLSAMLPGPDFAMVVKNTVLHTRRAGIFTSLGISAAILIHIAYCLLGLGLIISQSIVLFTAIKYVGAVYLIYLGVNAFLSPVARTTSPKKTASSAKALTDFSAFRQGFICNLFNPKATLFFLALFTVLIKPDIPLTLQLTYAIEIVLIVAAWFISLTLLLSHPRVLNTLNKIEKYIAKALGVFLIGFGIALAFL